MSETYGQTKYGQSAPIQDKFLNSDGSVRQMDGTDVEGATESNRVKNGIVVAPRGTVYKAVEIKT